MSCPKSTNQRRPGVYFFTPPLPPDYSRPPTILRNAHADEASYSPSQGSYDPNLSNGNQLLCYGPVPVVRELGPDGDLRWEARFRVDDAVQSYGAFKQTWRGTPQDWYPSLYIEVMGKGKRDAVEAEEDEKLELYVSWNGATEVTIWNTYMQKDDSSEWVQIGAAKRRGFETVMKIGVGRGNFFFVGAVEGEEEVRRSNKVCT